MPERRYDRDFAEHDEAVEEGGVFMYVGTEDSSSDRDEYAESARFTRRYQRKNGDQGRDEDDGEGHSDQGGVRGDDGDEGSLYDRLDRYRGDIGGGTGVGEECRGEAVPTRDR